MSGDQSEIEEKTNVEDKTKESLDTKHVVKKPIYVRILPFIIFILTSLVLSIRAKIISIDPVSLNFNLDQIIVVFLMSFIPSIVTHYILISVYHLLNPVKEDRYWTNLEILGILQNPFLFSIFIFILGFLISPATSLMKFSLVGGLVSDNTFKYVGVSFLIGTIVYISTEMLRELSRHDGDVKNLEDRLHLKFDGHHVTIVNDLVSHAQTVESSLSTHSHNVETGLKTHSHNVETGLKTHSEECVNAYYTGVYQLISGRSDFYRNLKNLFEKFEETTTSATSMGVHPLKGVILDFVVCSLSSIGKNGFAMVDAAVDVYARYISQAIKECKSAISTVPVRPYWFVTDEMPSVTTPPFKKNGYGKGEHLRFFKFANGTFQRWMILDEYIITEMFLTIYIDKHITNKDPTKCPVCNAVQKSKRKTSAKCYLHNTSADCRISVPELQDIPEIWWFKNEVVNTETTVLLYTIKEKNRKPLPDKLFVGDAPCLDIQFEPLNLEKGILRIKWGDNAEKFAMIEGLHTRKNPTTGKDDRVNGYMFYKQFKSTFKGDLNLNKMVGHLDILKDEINRYDMNDKIACGQLREETKVLLANGDQDFKDIIMDAIDDLSLKLSRKPSNNKKKQSNHTKDTLTDIFNECIEYYRINGIPRMAYILTYDPIHPDYPLRVAKWKFNWDGDGNPTEGILNVGTNDE